MELQLADVARLAGAAVVTTLVFEILVKRLWGPTEEQMKRFGPFVAALLGIVIVELALAATGGLAFWPQGVLTGLLAGGLSAGVYDAAKAAVPAK